MVFQLKHKFIVLISFLAFLYILAAGVYSAAENRSIGDGMWWAFMTFTTVGYGDQFPETAYGRISGILLVAAAVFLVVPTITAMVATRIIGNRDAFTHEEQEEVKGLLREIAKKHGILNAGGRPVLLDNRVYNFDGGGRLSSEQTGWRK